jgi:hypothetical protein
MKELLEGVILITNIIVFGTGLILVLWLLSLMLPDNQFRSEAESRLHPDVWKNQQVRTHTLVNVALILLWASCCINILARQMLL